MLCTEEQEMLLNEDHSDATYQIQAVSVDSITVNGQTYTSSLVISPEKLILQWPPTSIEILSDADLQVLLDLQPEIILLGTGPRSIIPSAKKLALLYEKQFHVECMSTAAACRTYTILIAEGRKVVAGLIL
jgi:uncharacterized protein